jgi:hypothetical protein
MRIKTTISDYDGATIDLSSGFQLAVFKGDELSTVQTELRHKTIEGAEQKDKWFAALMQYEDIEDEWRVATKSAAFTSKQLAVTSLTSEQGVVVGFNLGVWLHHRNGADQLHVVKAFGA